MTLSYNMHVWPWSVAMSDSSNLVLSYNMHVWPWSVAMSDSSDLVRGTLYIVFCSFLMKNTHWAEGWKCLWRGHSVNQNRPLLSLLGTGEGSILPCPHIGTSIQFFANHPDDTPVLRKNPSKPPPQPVPPPPLHHKWTLGLCPTH